MFCAVDQIRRIPRLLTALLFVVSGHKLAGQVAAQPRTALTTEQVASRATPAVVLLRVFDSQGREIGLGSGFIAADGRVVTNSHVVEGADHVEIIGAGGQLLLSAPHAEAISTTVDIAVLPAVPSPRASLVLATRQPAIGAPIVVIGAPEGLSSTVSNGIVSALRRIGPRDWLQITAPLSPGSSGGPVLNTAGEVIGVSVAQLQEGQNLNFAVPAADIRAMLASPPGRLAFPSANTRGNQVSARVAERNTESLASHKAMMESIPATPLSTVHDTEFDIAFYGCYGNESGGVIVCVTDFSNPNRGDRVSVYRAGVFDAAGRAAAADGAADESRGYTIGDNNNWMPIGGGATTRVYTRFRTSFTPNAMIRLVLEVGGPFIKRNQGFPATQIQTIRASDIEQRRFFGFP